LYIFSRSTLYKNQYSRISIKYNLFSYHEPVVFFLSGCPSKIHPTLQYLTTLLFSLAQTSGPEVFFLGPPAARTDAVKPSRMGSQRPAARAAPVRDDLLNLRDNQITIYQKV
jgi:hypothetical protein